MNTTIVAALALAGGLAQAAPFTLSSPDLDNGKFSDAQVLNGFGCKGGNISPALAWDGVPTGTRSLVLMVHDPDAPTGSGFWHWTVFDIPAGAHGLARGAGNNAASLPAGARGGINDYQDTGATGGNGNYGGPCPPAGEGAHRYVFTLYALAVEHVAEAAGIPTGGTPALYGFVLNRGLGPALLGKASFTATYGR